MAPLRIDIKREPDKQRYINAIAHIESEEVPFWEAEVDYEIVRKVLDKDLPVTRSYFMPAKDYVEFTTVTGQDLIKLHVPWQPGRKIFYERGIANYAGGLIKDYDDLKNIKHPGMDPIKRRIEDIMSTPGFGKLGIAYAIYSTPNIVTDALGYEDYYISLMERPGFVKDFMNFVDEYVMKQLETVLEYPVTVINTGFALCMNTGPVLSNDMIEEFYFPFLRNMISLIHSKGVYIDYHCDGNNTQFFPVFIKMGIDSVNALESCGGRQDIYSLKEKYGDRLAFKGNIDVGEVLTRGTREEVISDVVEHIQRLSPGGGYICSSSHDISHRVPVENFITMIETIHRTKGTVSG